MATAEAAVLAADFPLALFAAEIALAEAEVALLARQNAVEALKSRRSAGLLKNTSGRTHSRSTPPRSVLLMALRVTRDVPLDRDLFF